MKPGTSQSVRLSAVCDVIAGQHIEAALYNDDSSGTPYLTGPADFGETIPIVTKWTSSPKVFAKRSDVLLTVKGAGVGKINYGCDAAIGRQLMALRPHPTKLDQRYLFSFLRAKEMVINGMAEGATVPGIGKEHVFGLEIPLPSLLEQRRIADILDRTDALRAKRRAALARLDELTQAIFFEMFGDPAVNPKHWPVRTVGSLACKFSDGPFGSNLKSSHYVESGIRVIRLQNIGVGRFVDEDRAYISTEHFEDLAKHECRPGDVLIGTLGDPNLRACIQPQWLSVALNKADCVQLRADESVALPRYISALLNHPSVERMAQSLMLGQTRVRISMGRLRDLNVPIAPLAIQRRYVEIEGSIDDLRSQHERSAQHTDSLFTSLQDRAFQGTL
ncbi:MAG TPA: hypothetical protein DCS97_10180 [Planctomycetes bacterium]|nr:hypothetical protein [Planctomycetota bacterium]